MPELDPEDWSPARKLEAVRVYGPHKDWRALERVYGKELPVRYVKRWAEQEAAGELVAGDPEPGDPEPFPSDLPELPERLPLSDLRALAELVEPRLRHTLDSLARTRDPRELKELAIALRASIETLIRLKALSPVEVEASADVDAGIEALVADLAAVPPLWSFTTDELVAELDHRGLYVWAEPPGSGARKPPMAPGKAPGSRKVLEPASGAEEPATEAVEPLPEGPRVTRTRPRSGSGRRGPRVPGRRRDPALEGLSERDRERLGSYLADGEQGPDQTGRGQVRRIEYPD